MPGLLQDPLFMVGQGLLQSANTVSPWSGVSQGLLASQRAQQEQAQMEALNKYREAQAAQMKMQYQEMLDKQEAAKQERARIEYATRAMPPELRAAVLARPELLSTYYEGQLKPKEVKPPITQGMPRGMMYDTEKGALVPIPGWVETGPEPMSAYQERSIALQESEAAAKREKEAAAEAAKLQQQQESAQWRTEMQNIGIDAIDRALANIDSPGAYGVAAPISAFTGIGGGRSVAGDLETIKGAIGLPQLIKIKEMGGTFGALSGPELSLLVNSLGSLDQGQRDLPQRLRTIKSLLIKAGANPYGTRTPPSPNEDMPPANVFPPGITPPSAPAGNVSDILAQQYPGLLLQNSDLRNR